MQPALPPLPPLAPVPPLPPFPLLPPAPPPPTPPPPPPHPRAKTRTGQDQSPDLMTLSILHRYSLPRLGRYTDSRNGQSTRQPSRQARGGVASAHARAAGCVRLFRAGPRTAFARRGIGPPADLHCGVGLRGRHPGS